jgi:hypothetical protein
MKDFYITLSEYKAARGQTEFSRGLRPQMEWMLDSIRANITDPNIWFYRSNNEIFVMNAGECAATLRVFTPKGEKRDEPQAEIESNLIKNKRAPRDIKRSSSRKVVDTFYQYVKTFTTEQEIADWAHTIWSHRFRTFMSIIGDSAPVYTQDVARMVREIYHQDKYDLIYGLCMGESGKYFTDFKDKFFKAYGKFVDSKADHDLLIQEAFVVQELPNDRYWIIRARNEPNLAHKLNAHEQYALSIREYPSTDALPEMIQSKLALMKMGTSNEVTHVGVRSGSYLHRYVFIDENFGDVFDTGRESKKGGDSLP